jgi:hypothetical protein
MTVAVENVPMLARIWVPVAVENERSPVEAKFVEVPFVRAVFWRDVRPETVAVPRVTEPALSVFVFKEVPVALEKPRFEPKRLVEVVFVPVAFVHVRFVVLRVATVKVEAMRFVKTPFVAKKFVVVALVPVAFVKVTPAREETPVTESVPVAVRLEVVRAAEERDT